MIMMGVPKLAKHYAQIASAAAGSIAATAIDTAGIIAAQLAADSVTTVKILDANVTHAKLANDAVESVNIKDAAVTAAKVDSSDDFTVGTLEAAGKVQGLPIQTKDAHHTGVALADLTAAFGAPATLPNGSIYTYKNDTDSAKYIVVVVGSVFQIVAVTPVTA